MRNHGGDDDGGAPHWRRIYLRPDWAACRRCAAPPCLNARSTAPGPGDLGPAVPRADAAGADEIGHHLEVAGRITCGEALASSIELVLRHAMLRAGINGQRIVFSRCNQRFDAPRG